MKFLGRTYKLLIIWCFLGLSALGVYVFLFIEVKQKNESVAVLQDSLEFELERDSRLKSIETLVEDIESEREEISSYFLSKGEDEVVSFLTQIEDQGRIAGVIAEISSFTEENTDIAELKAFSLNVEGTGTLSAIRIFIEMLETMPRAIHIKNVSIEAGEGADLKFHIHFIALQQP